MAQDILFLPALSELDPEESTEGSIDPLGTYALAERLASELAPGLRERQKHPRMLTCMVVGATVCSGFDRDRLASDDITEPWQVFEWYVVEGLVRSLGSGSKEIAGLPGLHKTARAIKSQGSLSARTYLKTPGAFGFHGVYRVLAEELDILHEGSLTEFGVRLVNAWEREQKLPGFFGGVAGIGADLKAKLRKAVDDGLAEARVCRTGGWTGWNSIRDHLSPTRCGKQEAALLAGALTSGADGYRSELFRFIASAEGQKVWIGIESERGFHSALAKHASRDLNKLLDAIDAFETFSRLLVDAFYACLWCMTKKSGKTPVSELARQKIIRKAAKELPRRFQITSERLQHLSLDGSFEQVFGPFSTEVGQTSLVDVLLEHHKAIQHNKPPNGKNPWVERTSDNSYIRRLQYRKDDPPTEANEYVHGYRTAPVYSFAQDLGLIRQ